METRPQNACLSGLTGVCWRWARTKIRLILSLGVALKAAIQHGVSSLRRVGRKVVQWTALRLRTAHGQNPL